MATAGKSVRVAGTTLGQNRHICAFFNGLDEQYRVLRSFIKEGFEQGDKAVHVVNPELRADHLRRLTEAGINVGGAIDTGQLEVRTWDEGPLHGGRFDMNTWLAAFEGVLRTASATGYTQTRWVGQMDWALTALPGTTDLIEFETLVNDAAVKYDNAVICVYDLSKFGASVAIDALRTHPVVIVGGLVQENPFFVPPEQFLREIRERRSVE